MKNKVTLILIAILSIGCMPPRYQDELSTVESVPIKSDDTGIGEIPNLLDENGENVIKADEITLTDAFRNGELEYLTIESALRDQEWYVLKVINQGNGMYSLRSNYDNQAYILDAENALQETEYHRRMVSVTPKVLASSMVIKYYGQNEFTVRIK